MRALVSRTCRSCAARRGTRVHGAPTEMYMTHDGGDHVGFVLLWLVIGGATGYFASRRPGLSTARCVIVGTAAFMSSEQARGKPVVAGRLRSWVATIGIVVLSLGCTSAPTFPGETWPEVLPPHVRLDVDTLDAIVALLSQPPDSAGVIIKDGHIVRSWGAPGGRVDWGSGSKVVLSTMLLFALHEGRVSNIHDPVASWGWEMDEAPDQRLRGRDREITFFHLANMISGLDRVELPGRAFAYNDNAVQLYAKTLLRVFNIEDTPGGFDSVARAPTRLGALGFQDGSLFGTSDARHQSRSETTVVTSPRDFARIGWLWLNRGRWGDRQLLPEAYFDELRTVLVPNDMPMSIAGVSKYLLIGSYGSSSTSSMPFGPGLYGMNWWFNGFIGPTSVRHWPDAPLDTFAAIGHYPRKAMIVIPSLGVVLAADGNWGPRRQLTRPRFWYPGHPESTMNRVLKMLADAVA